MKFLQLLLVAGVTVLCTGTAFGEVAIRQSPLTWQHVENADGDVLFNSLCAACHGAGAKGDGPAASALDRVVPDLTVLATNSDGGYPYQRVRRTISGEYRSIQHGTIDMPIWGQEFMYILPGRTSFQREAYARRLIHALNEHIENMQVRGDQ
jgi:hypothetical protein